MCLNERIKSTYIFQSVLQSGHADDRDPHGHHRAQEVTELQRVIVHDAHHRHAGLITRVIKLHRTAKPKNT